MSVNKLMDKATPRIGVATFEYKGFRAELMAGWDAAVAIDQTYGMDIAAWIGQQVNKGSRVALTEVIYMLQKDAVHSQQEIYETLFESPQVVSDPEFMETLGKVIADVLGSKFQAYLLDQQKAGDDAGEEKKEAPSA